MQRIAIIGCPGAGKSTFALRLGALLGIDVIHLDRLYWHPGWVRTPTEEWLQIQTAALQADRWIVDGNYAASIPLRLALADTVIFFDFPRALCLWRSLKRVASARWTTRPDMAEGCRERIDLEFLRFIWYFHRTKRPGILHQLQGLPEGKPFVHLRTPHEAETFLAQVRQQTAPPVAMA